jgi:glycosyltransferase involved in cell wall biosynthesis
VSFPYIAPPGDALEPARLPTISVLIPCFDAAETVADAVASALDQSLAPHEVVVCDDGSRDRPELALRRFGDRVVLLRKENGGGASALNHALAAATGELVAVLDADDVYDRRRLEALAFLAAARPDLGIVTTDAWLERDGERLGTYSGQNPFAVGDQRAAILDTCFPGGWPAVRRELLVERGGWDETYRVAYDWECWLRLILGGVRAGMVDEPLMTYRVREGSLSADPVRSLRERVRLLRSVDGGALSPSERAARNRSLERDERRLRKHEVTAAVQGGARRDLLRLGLDRRTPWRWRAVALRAGLALSRS